ncbi:MAG: hypothetical protein FJX76_03605 [Armatimonadetes bacterium]|nr:hypothetical protein [Armatimonadota bacterium]
MSDSFHVAERAQAAMGAMVRAVADGTGSPGALRSGLERVRAELDELADRMQDATYATDEAAQQLHALAYEVVVEFAVALDHMLVALEGDREGLLQHLEAANEAELKMRTILHGVSTRQSQSQEHLRGSEQVACVRCARSNPAGRSTCEACGASLPQTGARRIESDIVGAPPTLTRTGESKYVSGLRQVISTLEQPGGHDAARIYLQRLEQLQLACQKQLDALVEAMNSSHESVQYTIEIRRRVSEVREMIEAVRLALEEGNAGPLHELGPWLADQFEQINALGAAVQEMTKS